ncbi:UNVERIFIED_CONTAM: hypothetical protein GTU68_039752, partial [Idotea baltica]|nr:hypothetical protein [Idotea baltica]
MSDSSSANHITSSDKLSLGLRKFIIRWLSSVCFLVFAIVFVGGITRLTDSGLSMVDWKPIMGILPPITETDWIKTFVKYQQFPEFKLLNHSMKLDEFKSIFFWEYIHRILGRIIGLVLLLPFLALLVTKRLNSRWNKKLFIAVILVALQGLMGWFMVKSGLVDIPYVSHYRLAAHLSLAFLIYGYLLWLIMDLRHQRVLVSSGISNLKRFSTSLVILVALQVVYGAFVAKLKAG